VTPAFHDPAAVEDDDLIRVSHCREPVRDCNRRPSFRELVECVLHQALGLGVE